MLWSTLKAIAALWLLGLLAEYGGLSAATTADLGSGGAIGILDKAWFGFGIFLFIIGLWLIVAAVVTLGILVDTYWPICRTR